MNSAKHTVLQAVPTAKRQVVRDSEILSAAVSGSSEAFAELYALYSPRLYKAIFSIMRNPADTEDVLQETFLRVYLALHSFEGRSSFYSWLTQIAINTALMSLRKRRTRAKISFDPHSNDSDEIFCFEIKDPAPNPEQVCHANQLRLKLLRAIEGLRPCLREPIEMHLANQASMKEISHTLNISIASVKARLHRARSRLSATHILKSCTTIAPHSKFSKPQLMVADEGEKVR